MIIMRMIIIAALCLMGTAAMAQQNLSWGQGPQVASPVVNADNSVTFNLIAPEAQKVQVTGDFLPSKKIEFQGNTYDAPADPVNLRWGRRSSSFLRSMEPVLSGSIMFSMISVCSFLPGTS